MSLETQVVSPIPGGPTVRAADGRVLQPPADWLLVPPGDPGLTRRIKAAGPTWTVQERKGRKTFSHGVWAKASVVDAIRLELAAERAKPQYARKRQADARRRDRAQSEYVQTFHTAVLGFLAFHPNYAQLAERLAAAVTAHATPVGSGTVARTRRVPVHARAQAAVIAWMRHRTTAYDLMQVPRVKGKRRQVRRMLALRSKAILESYRTAHHPNPGPCPLTRALSSDRSQTNARKGRQCSSKA